MNGYGYELLEDGGPYGYLPPGQGEEPGVIEGEYREVLPEVREEPVTESFEPAGEVPDIEEARRRRGAARLGEEYERERVQAAIAKQRLEREKLAKERLARKKAQFELGKARREEVSKTAGRISKAFAPAGAPGGVAQFYLGRPGKGLYVPSTPSAERLRENPAKRALVPHVERLRRAAAPGSGTMMPIAKAVAPGQRLAQPLQYGFLRQFALPSGSSRLEQAVFAEIRSNHDVDTMEHIKDELVKLGYGRPQIEQAVRSLEHKGFVEKQRQLPGGLVEYVVR